MGMVEERLSRPDAKAGFIFDGFPRTIPQAEQLDAILKRRGFGKPIVVEFHVSPDVLLHRVAGRWTCSVGGETYNVFERPPKVPGVCDNDGGKLVQRADDRPEVVKERLAAYERQTKPLDRLLPQEGRARSCGWHSQRGRSKPCAGGNFQACGRARWSSVNRRQNLRRCIGQD